MLRDQVNELYLEKDYNCAETTLRSIDAVYHLGLTEEEFKLVSGFGAGMGCGHACGALCGGIAALGKLFVDKRAHNTPGFGDLCKAYVEAFRENLGDTMCDALKAKYKRDDVRCLETVQRACDTFDAYYASICEKKAED